MDVLQAFFARYQLPLEELVRVRKAKLMREWWNAFAAPHKQPSQIWPAISKDSLWEVFSVGCAPSLEGAAAWEAFTQIEPCQFLVAPNSRCPLYRCDATGCGDFSGLIRDLENLLETDGRKCLDTYVMDLGFNWTWVFTHESGWGMGPYYAMGVS